VLGWLTRLGVVLAAALLGHGFVQRRRSVAGDG